MSWSATLTISNVDTSSNTVTASGPATGTGDDSTLTNVSVVLAYSAAPPTHLAPGGQIIVSGDC